MSTLNFMAELKTVFVVLDFLFTKSPLDRDYIIPQGSFLRTVNNVTAREQLSKHRALLVLETFPFLFIFSFSARFFCFEDASFSPRDSLVFPPLYLPPMRTLCVCYNKQSHKTSVSQRHRTEWVKRKQGDGPTVVFSRADDHDCSRHKDVPTISAHTAGVCFFLTLRLRSVFTDQLLKVGTEAPRVACV